MIKFENIDLIFNERYILKNFNYTIENNSKILITGKSGIGKSSLFNLILKFIMPNSGNISVLENSISYIPQELYFLDGTVLDNIKTIFSFKQNLHLKFDIKKIIELFSIFHLKDTILNQSTEKLSGGEKQRFAIILSILLDRKIYLLDEPTSALDKNMKKFVVDYFNKLENKTVLIISHDSEWMNLENFQVLNLEEFLWK